jgi:hypothetical protein
MDKNTYHTWMIATNLESGWYGIRSKYFGVDSGRVRHSNSPDFLGMMIGNDSASNILSQVGTESVTGFLLHPSVSVPVIDASWSEFGTSPHATTP